MYLVIMAALRSRVQDARGGRDERDDMAEGLGSEGLGMGNLWLSSHVTIAVH
jgi:hypothetical protein